MNLETGHMFVSRDVIFYEAVFPCHNSATSPSNIVSIRFIFYWWIISVPTSSIPSYEIAIFSTSDISSTSPQSYSQSPVTSDMLEVSSISPVSQNVIFFQSNRPTRTKIFPANSQITLVYLSFFVKLGHQLNSILYNWLIQITSLIHHISHLWQIQLLFMNYCSILKQLKLLIGVKQCNFSSR